MEEVKTETPAGQGDLLMECDEEEQVWPQSLKINKEEEEEEEGHDEALESALSPVEDEEKHEAPSARIIPIPVQPVSSCSSPQYSNTHDTTVKCPGFPLSFKVNGQLVPLLPGGAELKLLSHPGGSASGFTKIQTPVPLDVLRPAGSHHINTMTTLTASPPPPPETDPIPIITGVVSGEAAQRVLSSHSVDFKSRPPLTGLKAPPSAPDPLRGSPQKQAAAPSRSKSRPAAPIKRIRKGQLGPVSPPGCLVCMSQYKLIMELRGFMCLCSPAITKSLRNLRRKNSRGRSRDKKKSSRARRDVQMSSKVFKIPPGPPAAKSPPAQSVTQFKVASPIQQSRRPSDDLQSDQFTTPPIISRPQRDESQPSPGPPGKLVIMVEDFYYGSAPGRSSINSCTVEQNFQCIHCPQTLNSNIKLMRHMEKHSGTMSLQDGHANEESSCPYCYRLFSSPVKVNNHLEAVHSQYESTAACKICELDFGSEPAFLLHMKSTHKPGEMPYVCQVCDYRSSFYSDVLCHFEKVHANTEYLLCHYCLRVLRSNTCYQQHFAKHQRKRVFSCDKCRLHFLFIKDRMEHIAADHRTHIKPPQLSGLKPGTKVTVRTYSVAGGCGNKNKPLKVVDVDPPPPTEGAPKRKSVESLGLLLSSLSQESEEADVSRPPRHCLECLSLFQDFRSHFPSLVHCSLCRFSTCCSTAYANHMISNHTTCRKRPQYHSIFLSQQRFPEKLRCASCVFTTYRGDVMANHLTERPDHHCIMLTHSETENTQLCDGSCRDTSPVGQGTFIPISQLPSAQASNQLSVKALTSPVPPSSPAMTIEFLGPNRQPEPIRQLDLSPTSPLSASQLEAVLFSLCRGLPQASRRYRTSSQTIRSWTRQQERHLSDTRWRWQTENLAEWVLCQREQQLKMGDGILLQMAKKVLGGDSQLMDCYSWAVDFLLRHDLSLRPLSADDPQNPRGKLPRRIRDNSHAFANVLSGQIHSKASQAVASMDEFSIYINWDQFSNQNLWGLRLFGSPGEKPLFDVVLSALSDGTLLPPVLLFRGTPLHVPDGFPDNVLLAGQQEEITDEDCHRTWIDKVWRPHVASQRDSLLIVDIHRGHLTDKFRSSLSTMSTTIFFIPSGCCCRLQPLDVCMKPVLSNFLQIRWSQLLSEGGLEGLGLDQLALTLGCWLSEVSSTLNSDKEILRRSFASVSSQQEVETRSEAARMIQALTAALVQPLQMEAAAYPQTQLELLLVMEQKKGEQGRKIEVEEKKDVEEKKGEQDRKIEVEEKKDVEEEMEEKKGEQDRNIEVEEEDVEEEVEEEVEEVEQETELMKSPSALRLVLDEDSDQDSFHDA